MYSVVLKPNYSFLLKHQTKLRSLIFVLIIPSEKKKRKLKGSKFKMQLLMKT